MERRRRPRETEARRAEERSSLGAGQSDGFNRPSSTALKNNNWRTGPTDITFFGPSSQQKGPNPVRSEAENRK